MSKSIEAIREALAAGPTPGRWKKRKGFRWGAEVYPDIKIKDGIGVPTEIAEVKDSYDEWRKNAAFIAACNPAAIAELLAELDAALSRASEVEARVRDECAEFLLNNYQDYATIAALCAAIRSMRPTGDSGVQS